MVSPDAKVFFVCRNEQDGDHLHRIRDDRVISSRIRSLRLSSRRRSLFATLVLDIHVDECGKGCDINVDRDRAVRRCDGATVRRSGPKVRSESPALDPRTGPSHSTVALSHRRPIAPLRSRDICVDRLPRTLTEVSDSERALWRLEPDASIGARETRENSE